MIVNADASCGTSSNSGSSLSSPTPSPRNPSPEQMVSCHMATQSQQTSCNEADQPSPSEINGNFLEGLGKGKTLEFFLVQTVALRDYFSVIVLWFALILAISALLTDIDRRAPGCEKKQIEMAAQKLTLSDYSSKKVQAAKGMLSMRDAVVSDFAKSIKIRCGMFSASPHKDYSIEWWIERSRINYSVKCLTSLMFSSNERASQLKPSHSDLQLVRLWL